MDTFSLHWRDGCRTSLQLRGWWCTCSAWPTCTPTHNTVTLEHQTNTCLLTILLQMKPLFSISNLGGLSGKASYSILEPACVLFVCIHLHLLRSGSEVRSGELGRRSRPLCGTLYVDLPVHPWKSMSSWIWFDAQHHCPHTFGHMVYPNIKNSKDKNQAEL